MNEQPKPLPAEAVITINGFVLNDAESMTLRVAVQTFLITLDPLDALGSDPTGRGVREGYRNQCRSINDKLRMML